MSHTMCVRASVQRVLSSVAALAIALIPSSSLATRWGVSNVTIDLGDGLSATPVWHSRRAGQNVTWSTVGFVGAPPTRSALPNAYAAACNGRIVAAFPAAFAFSDDRGRTWRTTELDFGPAPLSVAFEQGACFGVAVGTAGSVWTSEDGGESWRLRRSGGADNLIDVVVRGRTFAFVSSRGDLRVSLDGGSATRELLRAPDGLAATLLARPEALWVGVRGAWRWRVFDGWIEPAAP